MSMSRVEIKHAANAIWALREHDDQRIERDAMREELERTRSRRVEPMSAEEYERRKRLEEELELKGLECGDRQLCKPPASFRAMS